MMRDQPFHAFESAEEAGLLAKAIVDTVREPLLVLDRDLRVIVCKGRRKYVPTGRSNRVPTGAAMNRRPDALDSFFIERSCAVLNFSGTA
jgi:hypothetical protein